MLLRQKAAAPTVVEQQARQLPGEQMDHINITGERGNMKPDAGWALCLQITGIVQFSWQEYFAQPDN